MATSFPSSVDLFTNPTTIKVDGVDLVRAAHVNDLQDATKAIENLLITPGTTYTWSDAIIPDNTPVIEAIKLVSQEAGTTTTDLQDHIDYVLIVDPIQHHANVIEVTPGGNLASTRLQTALEEHQVDIDNIMTGGLVEGVTLDDRYVGKTGNHTMTGSLTLNTNLTVNGNTILGDSGADTVTVYGVTSFLNGLSVTGNASFTGTLTLADLQFVGIDQYSSLSFDADDVYLKAKEDLIFQVDADDLVDAGPFSGTFRWKDGNSSDVMTLSEAGLLTLVDLTASSTITAPYFHVLNGTNTNYNLGSIQTDNSTFHIILDQLSTSGTENLFVTKNNYSGTNLTHADLLLALDQAYTLTTGIHKLKPGVQETGFFGLKEYSPNPGSIFYGAGVNFKTVMTNAPSSITLTPLASTNIQNLSVTFSNVYGFFFEFASVAAGATSVYGTYTTVGN